ncbi:MAG TPA: hypothetical protein VFC21_09260 [Bryobacteraceae bacterium]|nr:hypothetical protein [Bryobacteraceae bacterium]
MPEPLSMCLCCAAIVAVILASRSFGRLIGMLAAATCGASVAFVMPPAFSFQVDGWFDQVVLGVYGAFSLLVVARSPVRRRFKEWIGFSGTRAEPQRTELAHLAHQILFSEGLNAANLPLAIFDFTIEGSSREAERLLREVLDNALSQPGTQKISIFGGRRPGVDIIWVAAQYRDLPEGPYSLSSARKNETLLSGTPAWFDNGYERIYRISLIR